MENLIHIPEPTLRFGHQQGMEDPHDGLTLFGPYDDGKVYGIRAGVIGTKEGILRFKNWVEQIQVPIQDLDKKGNPMLNRPFFPGFQAAFKIPWSSKPVREIVIPDGEIEKHLYLDDPYKRVFETVEVYSERILKAKREEDVSIDMWFVIIPEDIYKLCRPKSTVATSLRVKTEGTMKPKDAQKLRKEPTFFEEVNEAAIPYQYEVNFHNQLKARLLKERVLTQIVRETTIAPDDFLNQFGKRLRDVDVPSAIAWQLSTAVFYKAGGRPWKINQIREGVCYIGLVFKRDERNPDPSEACCAAQMFLDSGDGVVFRGAVGPWRTSKRGEYHLSYEAARELVGMAVDAYKSHFTDPPRELFLHGRVRFANDEWRGFKSAVDGRTNLVGVRIRNEGALKFFTKGNHAVLRGLAAIRDEWAGYLMTKGFTPRLQTYPGRGVPNPLFVDICRGKADIKTVLRDILALTKLNYNTCIFADGMPVTLKFADAVGEILTAGPLENIPPLPFRHYI
jgi:hypothetical protein